MRLESQRKCPACGSLNTVDGQVQSDASEESYANKFYPLGLRFLVWTRHLSLSGAYFHACTHCGLVWHRLDPIELKQLIASKGSALLQRRVSHQPRQARKEGMDVWAEQEEKGAKPR